MHTSPVIQWRNVFKNTVPFDYEPDNERMQCTQDFAILKVLGSTATIMGMTYCNATYDSFLCWPPTEAGTTAFQNCPVARLSDTSRLAFRRCGLDGLWLGRKNDSNLIGWTNYTPCFPAEVQNLFEKVYDDDSDPQRMFQIAQYTRYLEIVGFSASLVALSLSLLVFNVRSLQNIRTKIHRNLLFAMAVQVIVRLVVYFDQAFIREKSDTYPKESRGLDSMPYVCEGSYVLLEYGVSSMFCWMFIEGLFLHRVVSDNALRENVQFGWYLFIGWGAPVIITAVWAAVTALHYRDDTVQQCWYGYNFLPEYWVSQGPRLTIIIINLVFLLDILRVLIGKMNQNQDSELRKARKAARAALVLLPLLGITNILNMIEPPLSASATQFAVWSYVTHFLRSFQGFFISFLYCFLNGEVRNAMIKKFMDWMDEMAEARRVSRWPLDWILPSCIYRPLDCIRNAWNNEDVDVDVDIDDDMEMDMESVRRMYNDPRVLDRLPTIRFDEDTNDSNIY